MREVHIYTDRPARFWAQGLPRPGRRRRSHFRRSPTDNVGAVSRALAASLGNASPTPPAGLRWDLYLGPIAENIPYHPVYHPFTWRGWVDFGVGALGDMGAHLIDQAYWSLGLTQPTSIEATSSLWGTETIPRAAGFAARARAPTTQQRVVSDGDDRALSVSGGRQSSGGEAELVRRRPLPAASRMACPTT